jgi:hypothetical protein
VFITTNILSGSTLFRDAIISLSYELVAMIASEKEIEILSIISDNFTNMLLPLKRKLLSTASGNISCKSKIILDP